MHYTYGEVNIASLRQKGRPVEFVKLGSTAKAASATGLGNQHRYCLPGDEGRRRSDSARGMMEEGVGVAANGRQTAAGIVARVEEVDLDASLWPDAAEAEGPDFGVESEGTETQPPGKTQGKTHGMIQVAVAAAVGYYMRCYAGEAAVVVRYRMCFVVLVVAGAEGSVDHKGVLLYSY